MTVIRKAIVEIEYRTKGGALKGPEMQGVTRAFEQEAKAAKEVEKAVRETERATRETTRATQEFGFKSVAAFREGGEGAFRMMRGIALLSTNGSEDMRKLIQTVAVAQGAFDVFAGGTKVFRLGASFGPVGIAVAGVTTALLAGGLALVRYRQEQEAVAKATRETRDALREYETELGRTANRRSGAAATAADRAGDVRIGFALTAAQREQRITAEMAAEQKQQARIDAEQVKIRRAGILPKGKPFGYTSPELQGALDKYGGFQGIKDRSLQLQTEEEQSTRRQLELQRQLLENQREMNRVREQQERERVTSDPNMSPTESRQSLTAVQQKFDQIDRDLVARHQATADKLVALWEAAAKAMQQQEAANNAR